MKSTVKILGLVSIAITLLYSGNNAYAVGASTPFTEYEAEAGTLAGGASVVSLTSPPTPTSSSPQLEASGRSYVQLTAANQSVAWTNNTGTNITAINVRYSVPSTTDGNGATYTLDLYVNGTFRQALSMNSKQTWVYETSASADGMSRTPGSGLYPHVFWDEMHAFITGAAISPGSTIMLKKDSANTASFYWVDAVDLENPPAALSQPANSLSITSYGAVPNNSSFDNTTAIQNCINAAQSQGKSVWVPTGVWYVLTPYDNLSATGITVQGAGMWYSTLYHLVPLPSSGVSGGFLDCTSCTVKNLSFDENANAAGTAGGGDTAVGERGTSWLVDSVWVQHAILLWASGNNGTIQNCRVNNSWGDGININNVNGSGSSSTGNNLTVQNNFCRGNGDDGIAINSVSSNPVMQSPVVINNTTVCSWWANGLRIAGGSNVLVQNNLAADAVKGSDLVVGVYGTNGSSLQSGLVQGNTLLRGGSLAWSGLIPGAGIYIGNATGGSTNYAANVSIISNTVLNAIFEGIQLDTSSNMVLENNTVSSPGTSGIMVTGAGSAVLENNVVTGLASGQVAFNDTTNGGFQVTESISAASYNSASSGIGTETCSEGGYDVGWIQNGAYTVYNNFNMNDLVTFVARVASASSGGSIQVREDSPTGTLLGTATVPVTGGWQTWTTVNCSLSGASGYHNLYLVYTGGINVQWFSFAVSVPVTEASAYNSASSGIQTQGCSEGGLNVDYITNGSYIAFNNANLNGVTNFYARVASAGAGGNIEVRLDSTTGTLVGTATVPVTGGWQTWTTINCPISGASGTHNLYLVFTGGNSYLFNLEWFTFVLPTTGAIEAATYNSASSGIQTQGCSEGGLNVDFISNGSYTVYNDVSMTGLAIFNARVASAGSGGNIQIRLDSATGTLVGTATVPANTGGWQSWTTVSCNLTASTGFHNVYLVYTGGAGSLFNVEWFDLLF